MTILPSFIVFGPYRPYYAIGQQAPAEAALFYRNWLAQENANFNSARGFPSLHNLIMFKVKPGVRHKWGVFLIDRKINIRRLLTSPFFFFLQMIPLLFPCSDFQHPVITPTMLLMSRSLSHATLSSPRDVLSGELYPVSYLWHISSTRFPFKWVLFLLLRYLRHTHIYVYILF